MFPTKRQKGTNNDAPWFNNYLRGLTEKKRKIYRQEGKSERYKIARKHCDKEIAKAKRTFLGKVIEKSKKARNSKPYYSAVGCLSTKKMTNKWNIAALYPEKSDYEIADTAAVFFNSISLDYPPLPDPKRVDPLDIPDYIMPHQVAARLRSFRKPKSTVFGDINPELVGQFSDIIAETLCYIYNLALKTRSWPAVWKTETVHIIPKNSAPADLSELRNLSCTPLFSKVLESFILDRLKREVQLSPKQYGGIKGSSTDHFLADTWDKILTTLFLL